MCSRAYVHLTRISSRVLLAIVLLSSGCFSPQYSGTCPFTCMASRKCPNGFDCIDGKCCQTGGARGLNEPPQWSELGAPGDGALRDGASNAELGPPQGALVRAWDTDGEWSRGTTAGTLVLETGPTAYLTVAPQAGSVNNGPGTVVEEGGGQIWNHWDASHNWIHDPSVLAAGQEIFSDLPYNNASKNLVAKNFRLAIPAAAMLNGVQVSITRFQSGTVNEIKDDNLQLVAGGAAVGVNMGRTGEFWGQRGRASAGTASYGASNDIWGATLSAAQAKDASFGITYRLKNFYSGANASAWVQAVKMTVHFTSLDGTYTTEPIALADVGAMAWDRVVADYEAETACGTDPLLLNVLDSNNTKIIPEAARSSTLLLTGHAESPIRIWVQLRSASIDCKPKLERLKLYAIKYAVQ